MNQNLDSNVPSFLNLSTSSEGRKSNCFNTGNISGIAKCLALCGFVPIPLKAQKINGEVKVVPATPWKDFQVDGLNPEDLEKIRKIFSQKEVFGVALKCGETSNLLVLDVDDPEKFEAFYSIKKLKDEASYIVQTKDEGHYHFGFLWDPDFSKAKKFLEGFGFEIKSDGSLVNFYTTLADFQYTPLKLEPLKPMPQELKEKLKELISQGKASFLLSDTSATKEDLKDTSSLIENILAILAPYYYRGQRQFWVLFVSGLLRKLDIPEEIALEKIKAFCEVRKDEELSMRIEAIKYTYKKPKEEITGLRGLEEGLGVREEDILRIKALVRNYGQGEEKSFLEIWTAEELSKAEFPKPKWIIPWVLPEGLSLLSGKPKIGKSWLALLFCIEIAKATGEPIFYLALEDKKGRIKERLQVLGGENLKNLHFVFKCPRIGKGGWKFIEKISSSYNPLLIVIDPWIKIKPQIKLSKKGADPYLLDYESITYFKNLTEQGINVLIVHHKRKSEAEDPLEEVLGTTGITGAVDNILSLKRQRGAKIGTLEIIARDFEEKSWGLSFEAGKWTFLGDAKEVVIAEEQKKIIEAVKELGGKATPKEVADYLGKNYHTIKNQMQKMANKGLLRRDAKGIYLCNLNINDKESSLSSLSSLYSLSSLSSLSFGTTLKTTGTTHSSLSSSLSEPLQNLGWEAKDYSDYSDYSDYHFTQSPTPTPSFAQPLKQEFQAQPEEDYIYLLAPSEQVCEKCRREGVENRVFAFTRETFDRGRGIGSCLRCGNKSLFFDLWSYQVLTKEEVSWFQYYRHSIEAKATIRVSKDGKIEIEGGKIVNPELFRQLQNNP